MITLRPDQEKAVADMREALRHHDSILFRGPTGMGKCLGKGTPVLMFDASVKPVEDVRVGDVLMGPDNLPRNVLSLSRGSEMLYRVSQIKGEAYVVNESHILSLKERSDKNIRWQGHKITNISVRDYLKTTQNFKHLSYGWKAPIDFPTLTPPKIDPYFMGLWIGDGASRHPSVTTGDQEIVEFMMQYAFSLGMKIRNEYNSKNSVNLHLIAHQRGGLNPIMSALRSYDLIKNKHVPMDYKRSSREDRLNFLAGFLDADGHRNSIGGFDVSQKSEAVIDGIIFIARSLGFAASKHKRNKKCGNNGTVGSYFHTHISGPVHLIPNKVERKKSPSPKPNRDHLVSSIRVEPIGVGDYYGFEIDGDRLFMLGDFTVTHNTVVASYMAQQATQRRKRVIFCVHRVELALQTAKTFDQFGIKYGFIAAGRPANPFAMAQIASADTLRNRPQLLKDTALFVPDEAHLFASRTRAALIQSAKEAGAKIVGLSATPQRLDGKPLDMFDALVEGPSEAWLIENGHLSGYRAYAPVRPDLDGLRSRMGDYIPAEVEGRLDKPAIHGDAIEAWRKYAGGKRTMVFAISRQHGQHVTDAYNAAGIPAVYIDGVTSQADRRARIEMFADGRALILVSINLAIEGFDLSAQVGRDVPVECVQLLNPTKSLPRARQMMGRALRKKDDDAIILDHVNIIMNADGTVNHGFPDDEHEWSLSGRSGNAQDGVPSFDVKLCESCFGSYRAALSACPYCSSERTVKPRKVEEIEGELAEIQRAEAENDLKKLKRIEVGRAKDLDSLADIAIERKYKTGWLIKQAAAKGINPRLPWKDACVAMASAQSRIRNKALTV